MTTIITTVDCQAQGGRVHAERRVEVEDFDQKAGKSHTMTSSLTIENRSDECPASRNVSESIGCAVTNTDH